MDFRSGRRSVAVCWPTERLRRRLSLATAACSAVRWHTGNWHMADQPLKYRRLRAILKTFGVQEDSTKRGKGSERMFVGVVDGRVTRLPTRCHNEGDEKPVAVIRSIRRILTLLKRTA